MEPVNDYCVHTYTPSIILGASNRYYYSMQQIKKQMYNDIK